MIQNYYNKKFLILKQNNLEFSSILNSSLPLSTIITNVSSKYQEFSFNFLKFFDVYNVNRKDLHYVLKEPIDVVIKYIDLTDKSLNRSGIKQIFKDKDNEELRYSVRSILKNIPWIRKIYIIMPNNKVSYFRPIEEIKEKIIYIKDKDLLGYDSANNVAFTFNLYKLKKFGLTRNFIYMDDDYFIGKPLKKTDFFYYDEKEKKVLPYILTSSFEEMNKKSILEEYNKLFIKRNSINPHSLRGFKLSLLSTKKFFIDHYNEPLIKTEYTHNAIAENIDDVKEIFNQFKKYKYFKETLLSKERYILRLSQHEFYNLYQLNINHRKIHSIRHKYISISLIRKVCLNVDLFVINTGGGKYTSSQFLKAKAIMENTFPNKTKYEIQDNN